MMATQQALHIHPQNYHDIISQHQRTTSVVSDSIIFYNFEVLCSRQAFVNPVASTVKNQF